MNRDLLQEQIDSALLARDFDEVARLLKLKMRRDRGEPFVGGQCRSASDIEDDGRGLTALVGMALAAFVGVALWCAVGWLLGGE